MTTDAALLDRLADGVVELDAHGRVAWATARAATLLGRPLESLAGERLEELVAAAQLPLLTTAAPAPGGGQAVLVKDLRPWVGDRPAAGRGGPERALGAAFRSAMRVAVGDYAGDEDVDAIARTLAAQGRRLVPRTDCLIAVVEPARPGVFRVAGGAGPWASGIAGRELKLEGTLVGAAIAAGRPVETLDAVERTIHGEILAGGSIRTTRVVPIVADQPLPDGRTAIGTIGFYSRRSSGFGAGRRELIDEFATLAGLALMRAALRRAARVGAERLETAVELALALGRSLDVREVVGRLLERTLAAVGAERVVILRVDGQDTVTEDYLDVDGHPEVIGFRHPIEAQPLMSRALATGTPVTGGSYRSGTFPERLRGALEGVRHTLTVPLTLGSDPVAVLVLSRRVDRAFGSDEVATIRLLGGLAALALRNAGLYEQAIDANRVKSDFLNMAAHELRTPFTVVAGYISMLRDGSLGDAPPRLAPPVETLAAKAAELGRLLEDLLLAGRLETGGLPVRRVRVNAAEAVLDALDRATPRSELLGADIAPDLPEAAVEAYADPAHLARILDNLVNNALSYARGRPYVRVRVRVNSGWVRIEVEDRGRGIPPDSSGRVFERFFRGEGRSEPGSGLGLYICRQLAERQAGRLELEWSREGEGSRFVLSLPAVGGGL